MKTNRSPYQNVLSLVLLLTGLHCSSNPSTTSPDGSSGQAGAGGDVSSAGAAGQAGTGPSAGAGGESGQGGAGYDVSICPEACGRLTSCEGNVDIPACEAQCKKELQGEGHLIPEIANDFFLSLKNVDSGKECGYLNGSYIYWSKWAPISEPKGKYDKLLEQNILMECSDALFKCTQSVDISEHKSTCVYAYYRYNTDMRMKIKPCFELKCPDPGYCATQFIQQGEPWLGQPVP